MNFLSLALLRLLSATLLIECRSVRQRPNAVASAASDDIVVTKNEKPVDDELRDLEQLTICAM